MKLSDIRKLSRNWPESASADPAKRCEILHSIGLDPANLYQELEMESRFVDTHQDVSYTNTSVHLHSHSFFELICCRNSCGAEYLVGAERYRLQKGDIILVPPGVSHRPLLPENMTEPYKRDVLWISMEFLSMLQHQFPDQQLYEQTGTRLIRTAGTDWEFIGDLFHTGVQESEKKAPGWEAFVIANTVQLIVHLRRAIIEKTAKSMRAEKPELLDQVIAYIENHLSEKITLSDVAHHFWVSQSTISQTFRSKLGISFHRCVTQQRLIAAKALILENMPLEEVSERVGFSDYSTFYRAFRQEFGVSPRQFRRLQDSVE